MRMLLEKEVVARFRLFGSSQLIVAGTTKNKTGSCLKEGKRSTVGVP